MSIYHGYRANLKTIDLSTYKISYEDIVKYRAFFFTCENFTVKSEPQTNYFWFTFDDYNGARDKGFARFYYDVNTNSFKPMQINLNESLYFISEGIYQKNNSLRASFKTFDGNYYSNMKPKNDGVYFDEKGAQTAYRFISEENISFEMIVNCDIVFYGLL